MPYVSSGNSAYVGQSGMQVVTSLNAGRYGLDLVPALPSVLR